MQMGTVRTMQLRTTHLPATGLRWHHNLNRGKLRTLNRLMDKGIQDGTIQLRMDMVRPPIPIALPIPTLLRIPLTTKASRIRNNPMVRSRVRNGHLPIPTRITEPIPILRTRTQIQRTTRTYTQPVRPKDIPTPTIHNPIAQTTFAATTFRFSSLPTVDAPMPSSARSKPHNEVSTYKPIRLLPTPFFKPASRPINAAFKSSLFSIRAKKTKNNKLLMHLKQPEFRSTSMVIMPSLTTRSC